MIAQNAAHSREQDVTPNSRGARVFVVGAFPPPVGGVTIHCKRVVDRLRSLGFEVVVINPRPRSHGTEVLSGLRGLRALLQARKHHSPVFVNYSGSTDVRRSVLLWLICRAVAKPQLALVQHSGAFPTTMHSRSLGGRIQRSVVRRAKLFMALSDSIELAVKEIAQRTETIRGCSFLPDESLLAARDVAERSPHPLVVTSGYRTSIYQFEGVISAFQQLATKEPNSLLEIYGYGSTDPDYWQTVRDLAAQDERIRISTLR